jgi:hypothetical protein
MIKFKSIIRGDTRRFRIVFPEDITTATSTMTWRSRVNDADPGVLQIAGVLAPAAVDGKIYSIFYDLTRSNSEDLKFGQYYVDFELVRDSGSNVKTIKGKITVDGGGG